MALVMHGKPFLLSQPHSTSVHIEALASCNGKNLVVPAMASVISYTGKHLNGMVTQAHLQVTSDVSYRLYESTCLTAEVKTAEQTQTGLSVPHQNNAQVVNRAAIMQVCTLDDIIKATQAQLANIMHKHSTVHAIQRR